MSKENVMERRKRLGTDAKVSAFIQKQHLPYHLKVRHAAIRAREFVDECAARGVNYHVSVGGLDSITLLLFLRSIHIDAPAVSSSHLEDVSIQRIHRELGVERLKPLVRETRNGKPVYWNKKA